MIGQNKNLRILFGAALLLFTILILIFTLLLLQYVFYSQGMVTWLLTVVVINIFGLMVIAYYVGKTKNELSWKSAKKREKK